MRSKSYSYSFPCKMMSLMSIACLSNFLVHFLMETDSNVLVALLLIILLVQNSELPLNISSISNMILDINYLTIYFL